MYFIFALLFSTITHDVTPTKLIDRGHLTIITRQADPATAQVQIDYLLETSWWAPVGDQRGSLYQNLPIAMIQESGYQELEQIGSRVYKDVRMTHIRRENFGEFNNAYVFKIEKLDHSWDAITYYHPSVNSTGWVHMELTFHNIPALGDYMIVTNLRR